MDSFDMVMPSRGRMAVLVGEGVEGFDGLLNRIFCMPIFDASRCTRIFGLGETCWAWADPGQPRSLGL